MPPAAPSAVDILPRHLQSSGASASSSSNASPVGTPPTSSAANSQPSFTRSPSIGTAPLPSPGNLSSSQQGQTTPGSPGGNRFGLALGFIQRRPRGWTTSSAQRSPATSPAGELPPSPSGGGGGSSERSGYGFPALRRSLSKRTSNGDGSRPRQRRSSSQPPAPIGLVGDAAAAANASATAGPSRPTASTSGANQAAPPSPNPQFSSLTATTSLPNPPNRPRAVTGSGTDAGAEQQVQKLRLVPHLESSRSLHFDPIERDLAPFAIVRIGRFTDRSHQQGSGGPSSANAQRGTATDPARVAFKSKVVSRGHAEIWVDDAGKFFIRDTKSSSGSFLNHIRLSSPNVESRPFALKDGDVLQLGVDYQGGTEEIYRCVKMRVELNRGWQRGANSFNTAALAQLRALGATPDAGTPASASSPSLAAPSTAAAGSTTGKPATPVPASAAAEAAAAASITDCCICLYPVTVCQALFIAPCSHVTHFKCIRPLVEQNYPGFSCPLCRTYANLEADVEIDLPEPEQAPTPAAVGLVEEPEQVEHLLLDGSSAAGLGLAGRSPPMAAVEEADEPASRAPSIRSRLGPSSRRSSLQALSQALEGAAPAGRRTASRPGSIAPAAADEREVEEEEVAGADAASEDRTDDSPRHSGGSSALGRPIANSSHLLSPPADDLYASLANAATPPNNTFLSTLADSGAIFIPPHQGSIDAAVLAARPGPSSGERASRSGSGASGSTDGEADDGETQEAHSAEEGAVPDREEAEAVAVDGRNKGKGKGKAREEPAPAPPPRRKSALFDGLTTDHPDPSVAAALLM